MANCVFLSLFSFLVLYLFNNLFFNNFVGASVITVLPGSRLQEVTRMLPIFSDTMGLLKNLLPDLTTVIPVAPNQHVESYISRVIHSWPVPNILIPGGLPLSRYEAFNVSQPMLFSLNYICIKHNCK